MKEQDFYTVDEFAVHFRLTPRSIRKAISNGRVRAFRIGEGKRSPYRIPSSEIIRVQQVGMYEVNPKLQPEKDDY